VWWAGKFFFHRKLLRFRFRSDGETIRDTDAFGAEGADQFTERGVFSSRDSDIGIGEIFEPTDELGFGKWSCGKAACIRGSISEILPSAGTTVKAEMELPSPVPQVG